MRGGDWCANHARSGPDERMDSEQQVWRARLWPRFVPPVPRGARENRPVDRGVFALRAGEQRRSGCLPPLRCAPRARPGAERSHAHRQLRREAPAALQGHRRSVRTTVSRHPGGGARHPDRFPHRHTECQINSEAHFRPAHRPPLQRRKRRRHIAQTST